MNYLRCTPTPHTRSYPRTDIWTNGNKSIRYRPRIPHPPLDKWQIIQRSIHPMESDQAGVCIVDGQ